MIALLRRYQKAVWAVTIVLVVGSMVGVGGSWFIGRDSDGIVARVGKTKIRTARLNQRVEQYAEALRQRGTDVDDATLARLRGQMLNDMMIDEMLSIKADELGLKVPDAELSAEIRATPAFQRDGQFDQDLYFRYVRGVKRESPEEYERDLRKQIKSQRVKSLILRMARVTPAEIDATFAEAKKQAPKKEAAKITRDAVAQTLQQQRAIELINQCLRQLSAQVEQQIYRENLNPGA